MEKSSKLTGTLLLQSVVCTFVLLFSFSCSSVYVPNALNVPAFKGKNELQAAAQYQLFVPSNTRQLNAQTAYSIGNHVGAMANYAFAKNGTLLESHFGEVGVGYYANKESLYYDCYVGFGLGKGVAESSFLTSSVGNHLNTRYTRAFIQPTIGYQWEKLTLLYSIRTSIIHFNDTYTNIETGDKAISNRQPVYYWDFTPTAVYSVEKHLSIILQGGYSFTRDVQSQGLSLFNLSLGLRYVLPGKR